LNGPHVHEPYLPHRFQHAGSFAAAQTRIRQELFAYLGGLVKEKGGKLIIVNGISDHIHLLILLPPELSVSDAMRFVKANSSRWMKQRFGKPFAWQKGFGAFSVSRSAVPAVARYIRDQEAHHKTMDLKTEFMTLLKKNEVDFDEEFLWR
jgi:putative transposase